MLRGLCRPRAQFYESMSLKPLNMLMKFREWDRTLSSGANSEIAGYKTREPAAVLAELFGKGPASLWIGILKSEVCSPQQNAYGPLRAQILGHESGSRDFRRWFQRVSPEQKWSFPKFDRKKLQGCYWIGYRLAVGDTTWVHQCIFSPLLFPNAVMVFWIRQDYQAQDDELTETDLQKLFLVSRRITGKINPQETIRALAAKRSLGSV